LVIEMPVASAGVNRTATLHFPYSAWPSVATAIDGKWPLLIGKEDPKRAVSWALALVVEPSAVVMGFSYLLVQPLLELALAMAKQISSTIGVHRLSRQAIVSAKHTTVSRPA
jgi:hypothetical protein